MPGLRPLLCLLAAACGTGSAFAQDDARLAACLDTLRRGAPAHGVTLEDFDRHTRGAQLLPATVAAARGQPEGRETWWDYLAKAVDEERVAEGRRVLEAERDTLATIGERYAVDPEVLVAIFGIETNYGTVAGKTPVLDAWLTRGCTERNPLWRRNVYAAIRLLNEGVVSRDTFVGSWSGAFGMTQFIPTSFYELAANGDDDPRIDLYGSIPDALASTANHLRKRRARWQHGLPAVIEVRLPATLAGRLPDDPASAFSGTGDRRSLAQWRQAGVEAATGASLPGAEAGAYLFAPTGRRGPVFLATGNFDAILHYNQSTRYALAVGLLAGRLGGQPALVTAWPTDDPGLSRAEIRDLQTLLLARGHDVGSADGIPGGRTREAVGAEQEKRGWPRDGRVGRKILEALRADAAAPAT